MDAKRDMMCKLKVHMDKGGHYDVEIKGWMQQGQYDVEIERADGQGRALRRGNVRVDAKSGLYEVQMKTWMEKDAL